MTELKKILFRFYSNIFDEEIVETLWANEIDNEKGIYKIDNIPFYIPSVAPEDIVFAEFDKKEGMLTFREVIEYSDNSVIQVILMNSKTDINNLRNSFLKNGCKSEKMNDNYFSMEVPGYINFRSIKNDLKNLEENGIIEFAEPVLSEKHKNQIE